MVIEGAIKFLVLFFVFTVFAKDSSLVSGLKVLFLLVLSTVLISEHGREQALTVAEHALWEVK